ncbi:hypothetical protein CEXT_476021 [Caerostris extrusa]|uniref:Uncharacterized protein n=1 Tax=Caerostris extrusa TaxID=172846 RepID=A0AAV4U1V4_CAEEX|nr:hypothetical protein CEXT_476021 [Caerostris extrusa]
MKSGPVNTVEDIRGYRTFIIGRRHWDGKRNGYGQPFQRVPLHFFIRKSLQAFIFWKTEGNSFDIHKLHGMNNKCAQLWDYTINLEFLKQLSLENPRNRLQRMNVPKYSMAKEAENFHSTEISTIHCP